MGNNYELPAANIIISPNLFPSSIWSCITGYIGRRRIRKSKTMPSTPNETPTAIPLLHVAPRMFLFHSAASGRHCWMISIAAMIVKRIITISTPLVIRWNHLHSPMLESCWVLETTNGGRNLLLRKYSQQNHG